MGATAAAPIVRTTALGDAAVTCLHYPGGGPPLLMLHATGFIPWLWHPVVQALDEAYAVTAPALYDHRPADPAAGGLDWHLLARDVARLGEALGLVRPLLVGHSMGGTLLLIAHARFGLPAAGMVLIEPILFPRAFYGHPLKVADHPLASRALKRTDSWPDREAARAHFRNRPLFRDWDGEALDLYVAHGLVENGAGGVRLACTPRQEASLFMGGMHFDPWPLLPEVACPVLLLEGEKSDTRRYVDMGAIAGALPAAELRTVAGAGHLIPMEHPRETARLVGDFFRPLRAAVQGT